MWIIEQNVFPNDQEARLRQALISHAVPCSTFSSAELRAMLPQITANDVPRGSCWFISQLQQSTAWQAEIWGTADDFSYSSYATRYQKFLLNAPYREVSFHEFCWTCEDIFPDCGDGVFVRPDDGFKSIEGQLVRFRDVDAWISRCELLQIRGSAPLIVAPPREIFGEWRCLVVNDHLVASSQYKPNYAEGTPDNVRQFVEQVHRSVEAPCRAYAIDIAKTPDGLRIVEIGCICCVAFYESDSSAILTALTEMTPPHT